MIPFMQFTRILVPEPVKYWKQTNATLALTKKKTLGPAVCSRILTSVECDIPQGMLREWLGGSVILIWNVKEYTFCHLII